MATISVCARICVTDKTCDLYVYILRQRQQTEIKEHVTDARKAGYNSDRKLLTEQNYDWMELVDGVTDNSVVLPKTQCGPENEKLKARNHPPKTTSAAILG